MIAALAALFSLPGLLLAVALVVFGYVLRHFVERKWPDKTRALDVIAKEYGDMAETKLRSYRKSIDERT